jgi:type VI protein secretion system component Hcp
MKIWYLLIALLGWMYSLTAQSTNDRITYKVTGTGFSTTEEELIALTQKDTLPSTYTGTTYSIGKPKFVTFTFSKPRDINSRSFNQAIATPTLQVIPSVEFKIYAAGAAEPYISFQVKNFYLIKLQSSAASGGSFYLENFSIEFENWGFKDWVNNVSYGFNFKTLSVSTY